MKPGLGREGGAVGVQLSLCSAKSILQVTLVTLLPQAANEGHRAAGWQLLHPRGVPGSPPFPRHPVSPAATSGKGASERAPRAAGSCLRCRGRGKRGFGARG